MTHVGVAALGRQAGDPSGLVGVEAGREDVGGEGAGDGAAAPALLADEEVGVDRSAGRGAELLGGPVLTHDRGPGVDGDGSGHDRILPSPDEWQEPAVLSR